MTSEHFSDLFLQDDQPAINDEYMQLCEQLLINGELFEPNNAHQNQEVYIKEEPSFNTEVKPSVLSCDNYSGPLNFDVTIQQGGGAKNQWIFSTALEKIFVNMGVPFPVDFKWDVGTVPNLFVRATPVFSQPQYSHDMVIRCIQHSQPSDKSNENLNPSIVEHVLRCQNTNASYSGDKISKTHYSVVVPLGVPQSGVDYVRQMFLFVCKNSCPGIGMSRRPINVVFTLEDHEAKILGRKVYGVRICSCPKRDKEKEENEVNGSGSSTQCPPVGKKRKIEKKPTSTSSVTSNDSEVYDINLKIVGKQNVQTVLKLVHDMMAGEIIRKNIEQPYKKVMMELSEKMKMYEPE